MKLEKCPFCGSNDLDPTDTYGYPVQVRCLECGTCGPSRMTIAEANSAWNNCNAQQKNITISIERKIKYK